MSFLSIALLIIAGLLAVPLIFIMYAAKDDPGYGTEYVGLNLFGGALLLLLAVVLIILAFTDIKIFLILLGVFVAIGLLSDLIREALNPTSKNRNQKSKRKWYATEHETKSQASKSDEQQSVKKWHPTKYEPEYQEYDFRSITDYDELVRELKNHDLCRYSQLVKYSGNNGLEWGQPDAYTFPSFIKLDPQGDVAAPEELVRLVFDINKDRLHEIEDPSEYLDYDDHDRDILGFIYFDKEYYKALQRRELLLKRKAEKEYYDRHYGSGLKESESVDSPALPLTDEDYALIFKTLRERLDYVFHEWLHLLDDGELPDQIQSYMQVARVYFERVKEDLYSESHGEIEIDNEMESHIRFQEWITTPLRSVLNSDPGVEGSDATGYYLADEGIIRIYKYTGGPYGTSDHDVIEFDTSSEADAELVFDMFCEHEEDILREVEHEYDVFDRPDRSYLDANNLETNLDSPEWDWGGTSLDQYKKLENL